MHKFCYIFLAIEETNIQSDLPWERSASAPCGAYNDDGLRTPWQPFDVNAQKPDDNANSESKFNLPCLGSGEIKEEIIDESEVSYNNKLPSSESNNKSPKSYKSFCNESMTETNTTKPTTRSDGSRTNGRKLISPLPSVSANKYKNTRHESKCKVSRSFYILN